MWTILAIAFSAFSVNQTDPSGCVLAPIYRSDNTDDAIGVTTRGTAFVAIRNAEFMFTIDAEHKNFGNWTIAVGQVKDDRISITEGFQGPGHLARVHPNGIFCDIRWPFANDTWTPHEPDNFSPDASTYNIAPFYYFKAWSRALLYMDNRHEATNRQAGAVDGETSRKYNYEELVSYDDAINKRQKDEIYDYDELASYDY